MKTFKCEHPLLTACKDGGIAEYQPDVYGVACRPEDGSSEASEGNLMRMLTKRDRLGNLRAVKKILILHGRIFILFGNTELYLALGFEVGENADPERLAAFCRFTSCLGWGDEDELHRFYNDFEDGWTGELPFFGGPDVDAIPEVDLDTPAHPDRFRPNRR